MNSDTHKNKINTRTLSCHPQHHLKLMTQKEARKKEREELVNYKNNWICFRHTQGLDKLEVRKRNHCPYPYLAPSLICTTQRSMKMIPQPKTRKYFHHPRRSQSSPLNIHNQRSLPKHHPWVIFPRGTSLERPPPPVKMLDKKCSQN